MAPARGQTGHLPFADGGRIFAGMMPYMLIVCLCLVFMYVWPGMTLWLPEFLYGK